MGNFFHSDLGSADAIVCYLMPGLMAPVSDLLDMTTKPGACVVSNTFLFRGRTISVARPGAFRGTVALTFGPLVIVWQWVSQVCQKKHGYQSS